MAAIKFGVSPRPVYAVYGQRNLRTLATNISLNTQFTKFAKYNSTPKFVDLQYNGLKLWKLIRSTDNLFGCDKIQNKDPSKTLSIRKGFSIWQYDEKMWIFGGFGASPVGHLNDYGDFIGAGYRRYN